MTDWRAVIDAGFRLPEGLSQQAAVGELATMLGDPDPVVRDELGYTALAHLVPDLDEAVCRRLGDELADRLAAPDLHVRSFAALAARGPGSPPVVGRRRRAGPAPQGRGEGKDRRSPAADDALRGLNVRRGQGQRRIRLGYWAAGRSLASRGGAGR